MAGEVKSPMPNMVTPSAVVAEKVANIAAPASSNTMWDQLGANKTVAPPISGGYSTSVPTPAGTSKLMQMSTKLTASNDKYRGFGTAAQQKTTPLKTTAGINHSGHKHGPSGECMDGSSISSAEWQEVAGGRGAGMNKGNTVFVDDKNWPVTLKEIIGSRMLTREQLEKASIQNVKKLISVGNPHYIRNSKERANGTKEENEELYYMFQRMMLEGFIRGVDITKEIGKQGGLDISIKEAPLAKNPNNIGLSQTISGMDQVGFNSRFWRNANEAERYQLFMHEIGHNLLNRSHASDEGDIMKSGGTIRNAKYLMKSKDSYNAMLNEHFGSATNKGTIAIARNKAGTGTDQFDPSWFPQLSGEAVKVGGGQYDPGLSQGGDGGSSGPDYSTYFDSLNKGLEAFRAHNQQQLDAMNAMMQTNFQQQQAQMNQAMTLNALNSMPGAGANPMAGVMGGASSAMMPGQTMAAGQLGLGGFDTGGFASALGHLEDGDTEEEGGNLASG